MGEDFTINYWIFNYVDRRWSLFWVNPRACMVQALIKFKLAFIAVAHVRMRGHFFRVSRLVVLPDYQGIGIGKRLLNFIAELYTSQINLPFYLVTSNPQLVRGNLGNWRVKRVGHGSHGRENTPINLELAKSISRRRLTVSLEYVPRTKSQKSAEPQETVIKMGGS